MSRVKQAVILAGGRGSRLAPLTDLLPKPMVDVNGEPFLSHLIRLVMSQGITEVVILTGYLGNQIHEYFGTGVTHGVHIDYSHGPESWSSGERLLAATHLLDSCFLLLYSDNYVVFDLPSLLAQPGGSTASMVLSLCPKTPGNVVLNSNGSVSRYLRDRSAGQGEFVEVGFSLVSRDHVLTAIADSEGSLPGAIELMTKAGAVLANVIHHPYFSVSDLERLKQAKLALSRRRVLLLDRDGVINVKVGRGEYVSHLDDFQPIATNWKALKMLSEKAFTFIIISNQAGVARGVIDPSNLDVIHSYMIAEMDKIGIKVLGIYVCPHNWDEECDCRKPKPGLFQTAATEHALLLSELIYVGDDIRDKVAAVAAGCTPVTVGPEAALAEVPSTTSFKDLVQALPFILDHYKVK